MKRTFALSVVVAFAAFCAACPLAAAEDDQARLLPYNTIAYLKITDAGKLQEAFAASGLKELLLNEGPAAVQNEVAAWERLAAKIKTIHVSFHGFTEYRNPDIDLLFVAELAKHEPLPALVSPIVAGLLVEDENIGRVPVYRVAFEEMEKIGSYVLLATVGTRLVAASDRAVLRNYLAALEQGRVDSLTEHPGYRRVSGGKPEGDLILYTTPAGVISVFGMDRSARRLRMLFDITGLRHVRAAMLMAELAGTKITCRLDMDTGSNAWRLLAQPATARKMPDYLPLSTVFCAAASIGDGKKTLSLFHEFLLEVLMHAGEVDGREDYFEKIREAERELGISFYEAAGLVDGEIGFLFDREFDDDGLCLYAQTVDPARGLKLLGDFAEAEGRGELETAAVDGVNINKRGQFVWSVFDKCALMAPERQTVENCIRAYKQGQTLSKDEHYRKVMEQLPSTNVMAAYLNLAPMFDALNLEPGARDVWARLLPVGATLTANDGLVEIRIVRELPDKASNIGELFGIFLQRVGGGARQRARVTACLANLRQVAVACTVYAIDHDDILPAHLNDLVDAQAIQRLPNCPACNARYDTAMGVAKARLRLSRIQRPASFMIAWCPAPAHNGRRAVAFADGHVEMLTVNEFNLHMAELRKQIAEIEKQD